jgi:hypothetical protein
MTQPQKKTPRSLIALCALSFISCVTLIGLVLWTGQKVAHIEADIRVKNQNLNYEQERLRVLKAEWSHLNSPERLDKLMQKKREWEGENKDSDNPYAQHLQGTTNVKGGTHDER